MNSLNLSRKLNGEKWPTQQMDLEEMEVSLLLLCRVIQFAVCRPSGHRSPLDPLPERDADRSQRRFGFAKSSAVSALSAHLHHLIQ